jgi:NAD(P)-dependent dehydrogenase (short-subunit alcohol dehydrogenase family)
VLAQSDDLRAVYPSLRNKRVLVTGGGSGIGAGIVEAFARQGSDVTFFDIRASESEDLAASSGARFREVDLIDISATARCIDALVEETGPIDVLINNAANDDRHKIEDVTEDYWDERLNVNLKHQFFCAKAVVPGMRRNGWGAIVN